MTKKSLSNHSSRNTCFHTFSNNIVPEYVLKGFHFNNMRDKGPLNPWPTSFQATHRMCSLASTTGTSARVEKRSVQFLPVLLRTHFQFQKGRLHELDNLFSSSTSEGMSGRTYVWKPNKNFELGKLRISRVFFKFHGAFELLKNVKNAEQLRELRFPPHLRR